MIVGLVSCALPLPTFGVCVCECHSRLVTVEVDLLISMFISPGLCDVSTLQSQGFVTFLPTFVIHDAFLLETEQP